jgi:hypothetical protein
VEDVEFRVVVNRLEREFAGLVGRDEISRRVHESLASLADSRVQTFVPVLAERGARVRLRALVGGRAGR